MKEYYVNLIEYNHWAYGRMLEAVRGLSIIPESLTDLFGHALITEKVWLMRILAATENPPPIWPKMSIDAIQRQIAENKKFCDEFIDALNDADFLRDVAYKNSAGIAYTNKLQDIIIHVCTHACYHRGQLNKMIREFGGEPADVDYIVYKR